MSKREILKAARDIILDQAYVNKWFDVYNDRFFGEQYITDVLKHRYFITKDNFMNQSIYALREITPEGIETIGGPLDSYELALEILEAEQ